MIVDFYHLSSTPLERALPAICEKVLTSGERLLVVAEAGLLARLDEQLWTYSPESFLPHGRQGAEEQPILLSSEPEPLNGASNIALADGQWREEALGFQRTFFFFDNSSLDGARGVWRALRGKPEAEAHYWKQSEAGKWLQGP